MANRWVLRRIPPVSHPSRAGRGGATHTVVVSLLVLLVPLLVLGLSGLLLYRRLVRAPGYTSLVLRLGAAALLVVLTAAIFVGVAYQNGGLDGRPARLFGMVGMAWVAVAFYLLIGTLVGALGALALRIARRGREARRTWHRRSVPVIIVASVLVTAYGMVEARQVAVDESSVTIPGLPPELEGYRVAVISDLHVGPIRGADLTAQAVGLANGAEPDVILLAGDLTDGTTAQFAEVLAPLADLSAPDGVYAVTGNHEYYAGDALGWVALWRELGLRVLLNESVVVERDGATLRIAGVSDAAGTEVPAAEPADAALLPQLGRALAAVDPRESSILIAHRPGVGEDPLVRAAGIDLMVSGHTHGGQLWPFTLLVPLANPTIQGLDVIEGTTAYTTRGVGTWGPPTRVLAPAEVSLLTLTGGRTPADG